METFVRKSSVIVRCELANPSQGEFKVVEMLKNDGTVALKRQIGDTVRLMGPEMSPPESGLIVFIGQVDPQIELWDRRDLGMLYVIDGKLPGLGGISVDELRSVVSRTWTPNKAADRMPGANAQGESGGP